ncbi:signal transduction histidine kinase [Bradyrhizobium elkanii]|uniref:PAS domain-containing sensor histidine kinase n=1 Tax=Bradyrhizobium TaxID=374 RepID=UPI002167DD5F|nr:MULTISPECIES: PAS domain-containing sensor histidine kinase [Bradyrhizobium]MCS3928836.1 signal transduction histidine kinase [Bradyrhizobium elkanii]MCS3969390.1 signal transduction histidine kinase [Bradyrhizobium japonicum]
MPWTEPASSSSELRRCIRDLVALSTLSAGWQNYDMRQIGASVVAALISMLDADFVFIALPGPGNQSVTELTRSSPKLDPANLQRVQEKLQERATLGSGREFTVADISGGSDLRVMTTPIGFGEDATLAAGSIRHTFPTRTEKLLLNTGANQAAIAFQQWLGDAEKRRFTALVQRTTDFVGIASLSGQVQYVNPAGLELVGLASLGDALRLYIHDFVSPQHRKIVEDEVWPLVQRVGRWKGELDLKHFGSGMEIPFQIDCFRIDDPRTGEPMNVATVSRDLSAQKISEATLRYLSDGLERRVEERTFELAEANKQLVAEKRERAQIDLHFQKLQNDLFVAARVTAAAQMAAALAHEISQPLTAIVNSVNATKRLLSRGGGQVNLLTALEVTNEACEQALRVSEIVRSLRQLVSRDETERRIEDLPTMIEEASAFVLNGVTPLALHLRFEFDDKAPKVWVNRVQIQQVIVNLVRNAFEAMANQESREVTLSTKALDDATIEIAVADIGPGIHGDIAGQLFRPFVSNKHDGMGLGLSISRSIIEAHDGQLIMEPNPRGGSIFRFTLPSCGAAHGD